nr:ankyrin repeat-containing domain, PGG domain protein [Tanacetum cinerariifolium]
MSFSKRPGTDAVCYTKPLDSLKGWNDHFFWVDTFACPALFSWYTEMDLLSFIRTVDPTKVRVGERERDEGEPKLSETTVGRVVPLLPVAPDRSSGDLEASVDKLFDEGADQGDSVGGGHGVSVQLVDVSAETVAEDVAHVELQHRKKRKTKVFDACEPSHPAKKLRGDYGAPGVLAIGEREGGDYTEFLVGANLCTLEAPQRFVISSDSSDPSGVNIAEAEVDSVVRTFVPIMTNATIATPTADPTAIAKEKLVSALVFGGDSSFASESHPISGDFSDRTGGDFLVGGIHDYEITHTGGGEDAVADVEAVADEGADPCLDHFLRLQIFHVRGRVCPLRSLSLYAPLPNAFVTSYGPFYLACSLFSSKRSKLIPRASLSLTTSTLAVLKVGMPISAGITASAPYGNENGVPPLLDLIMAIGLRMLNGGEALADT